MTSRILIIAEAGVNHNGDLELAKKLIDAAAEAGADLVKFQTFTADRLATSTTKKAAYQTKTTNSRESQHEMLRRLELTEDMHRELIAHCAARNIGFFSTCLTCATLANLVGSSYFPPEWRQWMRSDQPSKYWKTLELLKSQLLSSTVPPSILLPYQK